MSKHVLGSVYSVLDSMYSVLHSVYSVLGVLYSVGCILYSVVYTLYSVFCTLQYVHFTLQCVLCTPQCVLYSVVCTLYCVVCSLYSVVCTKGDTVKDTIPSYSKICTKCNLRACSVQLHVYTIIGHTRVQCRTLSRTLNMSRHVQTQKQRKRNVLPKHVQTRLDMSKLVQTCLVRLDLSRHVCTWPSHRWNMGIEKKKFFAKTRLDMSRHVQKCPDMSSLSRHVQKYLDMSLQVGPIGGTCFWGGGGGGWALNAD